MTEPAIKIEGLHFSYGKKQVLKGVNLEVPKGSIFGFIGRNGTGKTEQLRESVRKFILTPTPEADFSRLPGLLDIFQVGDNVSITIEDCDEPKKAKIKTMSSNGTQETALNLDEIFEAYVIGNRGHQHII